MDADPRTFESYLATIAHVPAQTLRRCLGWLSMFRERVAGDPATCERQTALSLFRNELSKRYRPREVAEACLAVKHYWFWLGRSAPARQAAMDTRQSNTALIDETRCLLRLQHKSYRTEKTYLGWIRRFLAFAGGVDRASIDQAKLRQFLNYLAVERTVSAATQQQAFNAVLLLFRNVLNVPVEDVATSIRAKRTRRLPVVLTRD